MSSTQPEPGPHPEQQERRSCPRRRFDQITFVELGPGNGGIVIDLSEGGLSFQGVAPLSKDHFVRVSFKLPGAEMAMEAVGRVVWSNQSEKGGGLQFVNLNARAREEVQDWIAEEVPSAATSDDEVIADAGGETEPAAREEASPGSPAGPESSPTLDEHILRKIAIVPRGTPAASAPVFSRYSLPEHSVFSPRNEASEPKTQNASKSQALPFIIGMACGSIVIAAVAVVAVVIAGMHRPENAVRPPVAENQMSSGRGGFLSEALRRETSSPEPSAALARGSSSRGETSRRKDAANGRSENAAGLSGGSQQTSGGAPSNTALLPPRRSLPQAPDQEPSLGPDSVAGPISPIAADVLAATSGMPAPLKPIDPPSASFQQPILIQGHDAVYPQAMKDTHRGGLVKMSATIGVDGVPREIKLVSGDPNLAAAARDAIALWRYKPAVLDGHPVESQVVVSIDFQP